MRAHQKKLLFAAATAVVFVLLPLWHESVRAPFLLEAVNDAVLRAQVPGRVRDVFVAEGDTVKVGAPLLRIENTELNAGAAAAASQLRLASDRERISMLRYDGQGRAQSELSQREQQLGLRQEEQAKLSIDAPIAGTVLTPRIADLVGRYVGEGTPLVHLADQKLLRARVYLPEADMDTLSAVTSHALLFAGRISPIAGEFQGISPSDQPVPDGLLPASKVKGLQPPPYYVATVLLSNTDGKLRTGMTGEAKIFGARRSIAGLIARPFIEFVGRKFW